MSKEKVNTSRLEKLCRIAAGKFGQVTLERSNDGTWRIWYRHLHMHLDGSSFGSFATQGKTAELAVERLLALAKQYPIHRGPNCDESCPMYRD